MEIIHHRQFSMEPIKDKNVLNEMKKISRFLDKKEYNYWFSAGTALGLYREEKGYIDWDTDIDLELIGDNLNTEKFINDLYELKYKLIRTMKHNNKYIQIAFINMKNNLIIDFYFYYTENNVNYIAVTEVGTLVLPKRFIINLEKVKGFKVPSPIEEYLTFRYGEWKKPKRKKGGWNYLAGEALRK